MTTDTSTDTSADDALPELTHREVTTNGVRLHVVEAGDPDGPPVLMLHGFPEFWWGWRHQLPALVDAGYRVWMPDQRGYNRSEKPRGIAAYSMDELAGDVEGLVHAMGAEAATVVGHDWGGAIAWWTATTRPDCVERLAVVNIPHPIAFGQFLGKDRRQTLKSWYMYYYQLPFLPELSVRYRGTNLLRRTSRPGTFSEAELARYRESWDRPGAPTAMLNWYRAMMRVRPATPEDIRVRVPTALIWGTEDHALSRRMAEPSIDLCDDGQLAYVEGATHWVCHEEPETVNALLGAFVDGESLEDAV